MTAYIPLDLPATILYVLGLVLLRILAIAAAKKFLLKARPDWQFLLLNIGATPVTSAGLERAENFQEMWRNYLAQFQETLLLLAAHAVENLLLLIPLAITFYKVAARHALLTQSVGTVQSEEESYRNCLVLLLASLGTALVSLPLQAGVFWLHIHHGVMWKEALQLVRADQQERARLEALHLKKLNEVASQLEQRKLENIGEIQELQVSGFLSIKFCITISQQEEGMEEMKEVTHSNVDTTNTNILQEMEVTLS